MYNTKIDVVKLKCSQNSNYSKNNNYSKKNQIEYVLSNYLSTIKTNYIF